MLSRQDHRLNCLGFSKCWGQCSFGRGLRAVDCDSILSRTMFIFVRSVVAAVFIWETSKVGWFPAELHTYAVTAANQSRGPAILITLHLSFSFIRNAPLHLVFFLLFWDGLRLWSSTFDVNFCHMPVVLPKILSMALFASQVSSHLLKLLPGLAEGLHQAQTVRRERKRMRLRPRERERKRDNLPHFCS